MGLIVRWLRASELAPNWRWSFSHFMTAMGWEVSPPILRSKPLAVGTTAKRLAPCLGGKPSQLPTEQRGEGVAI